MTTLADPPKASFRLSMLIYDTRYRSLTIQAVAMIGFMLLVAWLISNTAANLATQGKVLSFSFLGEPAGYDINQRLLEYNSQDTHLRAAFMGLLNTLVVAALGCITATIVGVFVGVMRLSNNWLIAKIMTVYVETFRNVPVLLQLLSSPLRVPAHERLYASQAHTSVALAKRRTSSTSRIPAGVGAPSLLSLDTAVAVAKHWPCRCAGPP